MFGDKLQDALESARRMTKLYTRAEEMVDILGLRNLEPLVRFSFIWQGSHWETDRSNEDFPTIEREFMYDDDGNPRVYIGLYIPWDDREKAREIVMRESTIDKWEKGYSLDEGRHGRSHYYIERWEWKNGEYRTGKDEVILSFYRPVQVGDVIDGCVVQEQERTISDTVLKCQI